MCAWLNEQLPPDGRLEQLNKPDTKTSTAFISIDYDPVTLTSTIIAQLTDAERCKRTHTHISISGYHYGPSRFLARLISRPFFTRLWFGTDVLHSWILYCVQTKSISCRHPLLSLTAGPQLLPVVVVAACCQCDFLELRLLTRNRRMVSQFACAGQVITLFQFANDWIEHNAQATEIEETL